jgi:S-adenosylmethionine/arginine decarboxylase-like enzyme
MEESKKPYGYELIMDLHGCDVGKFNRTSLDNYFEKLCNAIDMKRSDLHFWDDEGLPPEERQTLPHTKGTSAVQFILTSSIVVHTLDLLESVYINIFTCKPFERNVAEELTKEWFGANGCRAHFIERI